MLRAFFARSIEYRAVVIIWSLTSVLPLILMAVWLRLAEDGPIGGFTSNDFVAYYLAVLFTRRMTGAWIIWDVDREIRNGTLSTRLLRPMHPFHGDLARVLAYKPLNLALVLPPVALAALLLPGQQFDVSPLALGAYVLAVFAGLTIEVLEQWCLGCLAFWWSHVTALHDGYYILYSLLGGQIVPLALLPGWVGELAFWLPFRYLMSFQVEILIGRLAPQDMAIGFAMQAAWLLVFWLLFRLLWRLGLRQYGAVGA